MRCPYYDGDGSEKCAPTDVPPKPLLTMWNPLEVTGPLRAHNKPQN